MSNIMKQQEDATLTSLSASELARRIAVGRLSSRSGSWKRIFAASKWSTLV